MKNLKAIIASFVLLFLGVSSITGQVDSVRFQVKYDTSLCRFDAYVKITKGFAYTAQQRAQFNAQYSLVVPTGSSLSIVKFHNPIKNNIDFNGTDPASWTISTSVSAPAADPDHDFYSITPSLSPTAYYDSLSADINAPFDMREVKLFSFTLNPVSECAMDVRPFEAGTDPASDAPGMGGGDFQCGFTIGGFAQKYDGNLPTVVPPSPGLSAQALCAAGLEIDLSAYASSCQTPLTYSWSGPNGYSSTTEDVAIFPANSSNNGTYEVVVTDALGCKDSIEVDAIAKPDAGPDQDGCANNSTSLQGSEPTSGTWSADNNNGSGATLTPGVSGAATVDFDDTASGSYTFIYTNQTCSDSTIITVSNPDAGPNPNTVGCFSQGSSSLSAVGTGTWSVANTSAGTATFSNPSSASTTVTGFSDPGTYFLVWTVGVCTDTVTLIVNDECDCVIGNNILPPFNPSNICGTSGNIFVDGGTVTLSGSYLWENNVNGGAFSPAGGTNNQEDYTTLDLSAGTYAFRRIFTNDMGVICSDTSNTITLTVVNMPGLPANLTASPNPVCLGNIVSLGVDNTAGATYTWSASSPNAGLTNSTTNSTSMNATIAGVYTIEVFQTINGCPSDAVSVDVTVNPTPKTPVNGTVVGTNPTSCGGSDGSIAISGYLSNETYTVEYTSNGIPQSESITSNGSGVITITGLSAGSYSNFKITNSSNCSSGTFTGNRSLSDPNPPPAPEDIEATPSSECLGSPITISVTNNPGATYTWSSPSPNAGLSASTTNSVVMLATAPGLYLVEVTQTVGGCTSTSSGISVLVNGTPPTPDGNNVSGTDPSFCGGSDGNIKISGLSNLTTYIVHYSDNGNPITDTISTSTGGVLTIPNLSEGVYTNFSLSNFIGCTSGEYPGPVNLSDPNSPPAPTNLTALPNPACLGDQVALSVDNNAGATFNWTVSSMDATLSAGTSNAKTLTSNVAGVYTINVSQTVAGCTSPASSIDVTFLIVPADFSGISSTNPTVCSGSDGTITLEGLGNNTTYTLNYTVNNAAVSNNVTSNGTGQIIITGLSAGVYEDFQVINAGGCSNTLLPGPINLVDPNAPLAPTGLASDPDRVCLGGTLDLSVDNNPNATYTWSASPTGNGLQNSTTNTTTMTPTVVGTFNVSVFQTVAGCSSPAAMISVIVDPLPNAPDPANITFTNPSVCAGNDGSITIGGYEAFRSFTISYNHNGNPQSVVDGADANGDLVIPNLSSGSYTDFTVTDSGGCESLPYPGPINLVDPGAPNAPENLTAVPNPSCLGTTVDLSVTNNPGANYTWSASSQMAGLVASSSNTTTMLATQAGTYSISVIQEVAGCTSPPAVIDVVVFNVPQTPTIGDITATDPSACGLDDGMISFGGFMPNSTYTVNYTHNSNMQTVNITSDGNGVILLTNLALGDYSDFIFINAGNCPSDPYEGPITLVGPAAPPAPTGLVGVPNPICMGGLVELSVDNNQGSTYTWSSNDPNAGLVSSTTNMTTMQALQPGVYTISVFQTINGCSSPAATIDITVNALPDTPDPSNISSTNPSACSADDGTISIGGYIAQDNYILYYKYNGNASSEMLTADGLGTLILNDLGPGNYSDFYVETEEGCTSGVYAGPIILLEPNIPDAPLGLLATPNPVCLGNSVQLFVENTPGAEFIWMVSSPNGGLAQSTTNTNTMTPSVAGSYTVSVSQVIAGCTSPSTQIVVYVREHCLNPDFGVTYDDIELTGDLSTNDKAMAGSTYSNPVAIGTNPDATMPVVNSDGTYTFLSSTPGEYSYLVNVCKPNQTFGCEEIALVITVLDQESSDNPPVANHDYIGVVSGQSTTINIVSNDRCSTIPNCNISNPSIVTQPISGTFSVGSSTYTPNNGFVGRDSFKYEVCQTPVAAPINCDQEWVYVNVFPSQSNVFTNAMDDYAQTPRNVTLNAGLFDGIKSNDNDPAGNAQSVSPFSASVPNKGDISVNADGSYTFTPALDFYGPVDFAYQVCRTNDNSICDNATLHILVQPVAATGSIGDYVWNDTNGNGLQDGNEQGINNVIVKLFTNQDVLFASTITDGNGYYIFENIPIGRYYIEFLVDSELEATLVNIGNNDEIDSDVTGSNGPNTTSEFEVFGGENNLTIDAGFYQCVKIGELVWYDINENDVFDDFENGINGLRVLLWRLSGGSYVLWEEQLTGHKPGTPSDDGWYQFCAPPGTYYVQVIMPPQGLVLVRPFIGNNRFRDSDINHANGNGTTSSFTLSTGQSKLDIGAGYYPMARAGNLVWIDNNQNGLQDGDEERVAGVVVQAYDANTNVMVGEDITDSDGTYMIDYLDKREVYLKFNPPAGFHATFTGAGNDAVDSDVDHSHGLNTTRMFSMQPGDDIQSIDMGILNGVLPVNWVSIKATNEGEHHQVEWETSEEINVDEYIVERRLEDDFDFTRISSQKIHSANKLKNVYNFIDKDVSQGGKYYYRVKQIDFDGNYSYSNEVNITRNKEGEVTMYPNPAKNFVDFSFELEEGDQFKVEVYSSEGKMVKSIIDKSNSVKLTKARIHLDDISPGIYNVVISLGNRIIHDKLIKI